MSSDPEEKYYNIVAKNRSRALLGHDPCSTSPPPLELGKELRGYFLVELKKSSKRAEETRRKMKLNSIAEIPSGDLELHLREEWDGPQPEWTIADVLDQNNGILPPFFVVGFQFRGTVLGYQFRPDLRPTDKSISPQKQASSSTNADNENSRERIEEAGDTSSHLNIEQPHAGSSNNGESSSDIYVTHDDTASVPRDIDLNAEDEMAVKLDHGSSPDLNGDKFPDNEDGTTRTRETHLGSDTHLEIQRYPT